ncbi:MAG TPA: hypothetical protein VJB69_02805 [Candidatus Paceibacterota bacterium]
MAELAEITEMIEEVMKKGKVVEIYRIFRAGLHFNKRKVRDRWTHNWLRRQLILAGRAKSEALELLTKCLVIERDGDGEIIRAELLIPAASTEDEVAAGALLDPNRPKDQKKEEKKKSKKPVYCRNWVFIMERIQKSR